MYLLHRWSISWVALFAFAPRCVLSLTGILCIVLSHINLHRHNPALHGTMLFLNKDEDMEVLWVDVPIGFQRQSYWWPLRYLHQRR